MRISNSVGRRIALAFLLFGLASGANAQGYPNKSLRLLLGYSAGGGLDSLTRTFAQKLGDNLGQPVVVENRPGASGAVAADATAKSAPDGYTLHISETGYLVLSTLSTTLSTDPVRSFAPVAPVGSMPLVAVVAPDFPARNAQELIALLKASPGKYSYGSLGIGTIHHLAFEQVKRSAGLDVLHIPYKGSPAMLPDLLSGRIAIGMLSTGAAVGQVKSGKLRAIAVTSGQRLPFAPDWPALAETLPGFDAAPKIFLLAPAGTSAAIVARLNEASRKALALADLQESFATQGATPAPGSAEELREQIVQEMRRWGPIAKDAGARAD